MEVTAFLIVGLPGETMETVLSTAKFVQQLQKLKYIYYDDIGILNIYPGTEVCRLAKEAGALSDDYWLSEKITPIYTVEHSLEELKHYKKVLLDHISLRRFFTPDGFKAQYHMIPYIPRYLWERKELILDKLGKKVVKRGTHL
jgi:radical SAM superfamily enzyme YgiQ (UPF0313 family)